MARVDQNSVLMLIDVQKAWKEPVWGRRNNPGAEDAMERVLGGFRRRIHIKQVVLETGEVACYGFASVVIRLVLVYLLPMTFTDVS